jgi:transposase-like protein
VRLLERSGRSIPQVAAELGVSGESLRNWLKQCQLDRGEREDAIALSSRPVPPRPGFTGVSSAGLGLRAVFAQLVDTGPSGRSAPAFTASARRTDEPPRRLRRPGGRTSG